MAWGTLMVGRIALAETHTLSNQTNATTGETSVTITGLQSMPPLTVAQARAKQEDIMAMLDRSIPLVFERKTNHTGFYTVTDTGCDITEWEGEAEFFNWNLSLQRIGTENAVDIESRLASVVRGNDFALTGERWHAPSAGHYAYFTGLSQPSGSVSRVLANGEGTMTVYRGIPAATHPRWGVTAQNYLNGRARVIVDGNERSGVGFRVTGTTGWELNNGLIQVKPRTSAGLLDIAVWDTSAWSAKAYDITVGSAITPPFDAMTVIRNDFEVVVLRLVKTKAPGRILVDLTLRRGSRFVEVFVQTDSTATLGVKTTASVTTTNNAATGYIVASSDDTDGNRIVIGAPRTFTGSTTGAVSVATSTRFAAFVGVALGGASAVSGDAALDLRNQYIGALAEQAMAVKR